ncbi:hypothetical protein [Aeromicrobium sp. UC242_57]|uniref:hypothetical protein n=1 Tax=Aeromicrobium sp. UC242_57 TaxID=3374624 RepID=UPI0037A816F7
MFYGGALLSHLSGEHHALDDRKVQEFISLRRLNRHMAILIDSDRKKARARINQTKARLIDEMKNHDELALGLVGYTVENYIPVGVLNAAIKVIHPKATPAWTGDRYSNPLSGTGSQPRKDEHRSGGSRELASRGPLGG